MHALNLLSKILLILTVFFGLAACGGGGGGGDGGGGGGGSDDGDGSNGTSGSQWQTPVRIDNAIGNAGFPQIATDKNGNALAVWHQRGGSTENIWANRFTPTGGWGVAELLETDNASHAFSPQLAIDDNGNALAVWSQSDGRRFNIWANRFTPAGGWEVAELIETDNTGGAGAPQIAIDNDGNALAVWNQFDGTRTNIWANRYTLTGGWGTAELIETGDVDSAFGPQIAIDGSGNALAVWRQSDGMRENIWANRFTPTGGWEVAELIETDNTGDGLLPPDPQIAIDQSGNGLAVWDQFDGTRTNIWANRYTLTGGWGAAELIETDDVDSAFNPQIAIDQSGNALAVWVQRDETGILSNIQANRFTPADGWGVAELIKLDTTDISSSPQIAIDQNGGAVAVWELGSDIWANHFIPTEGWGVAEFIGFDDDSEGVLHPQIAIDQSGNALAIWGQVSGTDIVVSRFETQ